MFTAVVLVQTLSKQEKFTHLSVNFRFLFFFGCFFFFSDGFPLRIPAMACRAQQAQPETRPELVCRCQKELLLNVRGFASTQKRDINAFVE